MANVLKFSQFINESEEQVSIERIYDKAGKEVEKIIMKLSGSTSGEMTRLVNKFVETYETLEEAKKAHESVKEVLKDRINKSFTEEEKFITRIIQTVKYALTFSKYVKAKEEVKEKINYDAALKELISVFPDIEKGLNEIIVKHTEIEKIVRNEASGAIKYSHIKINEGFTGMLKGLVSKLEDAFKSLFRSLSSINKKIDSKFDNINELMEG